MFRLSLYVLRFDRVLRLAECGLSVDVDRPVVLLWDRGLEADVDRRLDVLRPLEEDAVRSLVVRRIRTSAPYTAS